MGDKSEVVADLKKVRDALEHALMWPKKSVLGEEGYNAAHEELSMAMYSLDRISRFCVRLDTQGRV